MTTATNLGELLSLQREQFPQRLIRGCFREIRGKAVAVAVAVPDPIGKIALLVRPNVTD
jgi:hypothetical protein